MTSADLIRHRSCVNQTSFDFPDQPLGPEDETSPLEEWRPVLGYEGSYEVSNLGRVRSLDRVREHPGPRGSMIRRVVRGRILKQSNNARGGGYPDVYLSRPGGHDVASRRVHRLVAEAFLSNPDGKPHVNHIDSNPRNPRASNLEWVTREENMQHCVKEGRFAGGGNFRLGDDDVIDICRLSETTNITQIAKRYSMGAAAIKAIVAGKSYTNVRRPVFTALPPRRKANRTIADHAGPEQMVDMSVEIWRPIRGWEGRYEVSNFGCVRSVPGREPGVSGRGRKGCLIKGDVGAKGYTVIKMSRPGASRTRRMLHVLVAETFIPNPELKPYVNHRDSDPSNSRADNLEWVTHQENMDHMVRSVRASRLGGGSKRPLSGKRKYGQKRA